MIVVVGSSRGLGFEIAKKLSGVDKKIIGIARNVPEDLESFYRFFQADITDKSQLQSIAKKINDEQIKVNGLINTAGIASMNLALMANQKSVEDQIAVNLTGTIFSCQVFGPLLIRNNGGRIINFSSISPHISLNGESIYSAAKSGVETFTKVLSKELAKFNITCNSIAPGPIRTNLLRGVTEEQINDVVASQIIKKVYEPIEVANLVNSLFGSEFDCITGQVFHVGGVA